MCVLFRGLRNLEASFIKGFNCCGAKPRLRRADSRFAKPRNFPKKVLIVAVGSCGCGVLIRGLQNLGTPCEGERDVTFCIVQKVTKKHARTCKKLPVASFCASETAETGRIANGREQGDHVSRRRRSPATSIQIAGRTVIVAKNNRRSSSNRFCEKLQLRRVSPAMI